MKKMLKRWYLVLILFALAFYLLLQPGYPLSKTILGHAASYALNMNQFKLDLQDEIDRGKLNIYWNNTIIFRDGVFDRDAINKLRHFYGDNFFRLEYDSKLLGEVVQYKYNNWHYHKYTFSVYIKDEQVFTGMDVKGPDNNVQWIDTYSQDH